MNGNIELHGTNTKEESFSHTATTEDLQINFLLQLHINYMHLVPVVRLVITLRWSDYQKKRESCSLVRTVLQPIPYFSLLIIWNPAWTVAHLLDADQCIYALRPCTRTTYNSQMSCTGTFIPMVKEVNMDSANFPVRCNLTT